MKTITKIALLTISAIFLQSCAVYHKNDISKDKTYLEVTIFQTVDEYHALARVYPADVVMIESHEEVLYDGKKIEGRFTLVDVFKYTAKNGNQMTVPVFVKQSELNKLLNNQRK